MRSKNLLLGFEQNLITTKNPLYIVQKQTAVL